MSKRSVLLLLLSNLQFENCRRIPKRANGTWPTRLFDSPQLPERPAKTVRIASTRPIGIRIAFLDVLRNLQPPIFLPCRRSADSQRKTNFKTTILNTQLALHSKTEINSRMYLYFYFAIAQSELDNDSANFETRFCSHFSISFRINMRYCRHLQFNVYCAEYPKPNARLQPTFSFSIFARTRASQRRPSQS